MKEYKLKQVVDTICRKVVHAFIDFAHKILKRIYKKPLKLLMLQLGEWDGRRREKRDKVTIHIIHL